VIESRILAAIAARLAPLLIAPSRPRHRLRVEGQALACFDAARMERLCAFDDVFRRDGDELAFVDGLSTCELRTRALEAVSRSLANEGVLTAWRDERYAASHAWGAPAAFMLERAAARYFGLHTYAAHANGIVCDGRAVRMWLARRSPRKPIDPGQLDNLVGGGMAAGEEPDATLVREAWEEAGVPADVAANARRVATLHIERAVPDGFQRETIFAYDLPLPSDFVPANQDGEAVEHRCVGLDEVARLIARADGDDRMTVDASLVALDCLDRHGSVPADSGCARLLAASRRAG